MAAGASSIIGSSVEPLVVGHADPVLAVAVVEAVGVMAAATTFRESATNAVAPPPGSLAPWGALPRGKTKAPGSRWRCPCPSTQSLSQSRKSVLDEAEHPRQCRLRAPLLDKTKARMNGRDLTLTRREYPHTGRPRRQTAVRHSVHGQDSAHPFPKPVITSHSPSLAVAWAGIDGCASAGPRPRTADTRRIAPDGSMWNCSTATDGT